MRNLAHVYVAVVLAVSGGLAGAAIAFRFMSDRIEKAVTWDGIA